MDTEMTSRALVLGICCCAFAVAPAFGEDGTVVQARAGANPLILWDATPVVAAIVEKREPRNRALAAVEVRALHILAGQPQSTGTKSLTIRVIYQKIGAVSPIYQTATFEGVERLLELTVPSAYLREKEKKYARAIENSTMIRGVRLTVIGTLPPM